MERPVSLHMITNVRFKLHILYFLMIGISVKKKKNLNTLRWLSSCPQMYTVNTYNSPLWLYKLKVGSEYNRTSHLEMVLVTVNCHFAPDQSHVGTRTKIKGHVPWPSVLGLHYPILLVIFCSQCDMNKLLYFKLYCHWINHFNLFSAHPPPSPIK